MHKILFLFPNCLIIIYITLSTNTISVKYDTRFYCFIPLMQLCTLVNIHFTTNMILKLDQSVGMACS